MASSEEKVKLTVNGRIATIQLSNPKQLNAMTADDYFRLAQLMHHVADLPEVYITVLTGTGRFFSAGADVSIGRGVPAGEDVKRHFLKSFVANNLHITHAFYTHPKILVVALNGPAIGMSAALTAFGDFVYATPDTFLLTPFSSLGLVAEGAASAAFVARLGISKANEALIMSKRLTIEDLVQTGYVNKVFETKKGDDKAFLAMVMKEIDERMGLHLNQDSLVKIKALIRKPERAVMDAQNVAEVFSGLERFVSGAPIEEFRKIASGEKKHKL
ncbi:hypothetical protein MBLNU457_7197t1 [Dothideomycetes sp. NU457]